MSDFASPPVAQDTVCATQQTLSAESLDDLLEEFRDFWRQANELAESETETVAGRETETIDLHTLLAQFVAMRHEVKLQTKATRNQQDQNEETLRQLTSALDTLQSSHAEIQEQAQSAADEKARPLLTSLIELHDALSLAQKEVARMDQTLLPAFEAIKRQDNLASDDSHSTFWSKIFGGKSGAKTAPEQLSQNKLAVDRAIKLVTSVATGYNMSLNRIERTLQEHELEVIPTVGQPFDPELMEIADVVVEPGRTQTEVIEEVRRGYLRKNRVFRFAQVRVAKPDPGGNSS